MIARRVLIAGLLALGAAAQFWLFLAMRPTAAEADAISLLAEALIGGQSEKAPEATRGAGGTTSIALELGRDRHAPIDQRPDLSTRQFSAAHRPFHGPRDARMRAYPVTGILRRNAGPGGQTGGPAR
jgi:hypothetical protein